MFVLYKDWDYRLPCNIELKKAQRKVRRAQKALDAAETDEEKKKREQELEESKIDQLYIEVSIIL